MEMLLLCNKMATSVKMKFDAVALARLLWILEDKWEEPVDYWHRRGGDQHPNWIDFFPSRVIRRQTVLPDSNKPTLGRRIRRLRRGCPLQFITTGIRIGVCQHETSQSKPSGMRIIPNSRPGCSVSPIVAPCVLTGVRAEAGAGKTKFHTGSLSSSFLQRNFCINQTRTALGIR